MQINILGKHQQNKAIHTVSGISHYHIYIYQNITLNLTNPYLFVIMFKAPESQVSSLNSEYVIVTVEWHFLKYMF